MNMDLNALSVEWLSVLDRFNKLNAKYKYTSLARPEYMLLHLVAKSASGAVKISELAAALGVSMPAVSKLLRTLEEKHAIARVEDITDRRITYIAMTSTGRQMYDACLQEMRRVGLGVIELVGEQEFNCFFEVLQQMYTAFETVLSEVDAEKTENERI